MKSILITFLLLALVGGSTARLSDHLQSFDFQGFSKSYQQFNDVMGKYKLQDLTEGCIAALTQLNQDFTVCQPSLDVILSNNTVVNTSTVVTYCQGTCQTNLQSSLSALTLSCTVEELESIGAGSNSSFAMFVRFLRLPCIRLGGEYCLPKFSALVGELRTDRGNLALAQVENSCHPCIGVFLKFLIEYGTEEDRRNVGIFDVVCLKDGNRFCYPFFRNATDQFDDQEGLTAEMGAVFCDRCFYRTLAKMAELTNNQTQKTEFLKILNSSSIFCIQNPVNGKLCFDTFLQGMAIGDTCEALDFGQCNATCKSAVSGIISEGGCCANVFIAEVAKDANQDLTAFKEFIQTRCEVTFPPLDCPAASVTFSLMLGNIKKAYYEANTNNVQQRARKDVAINAGVPESRVHVTGAEVSSTAVKLNFRIDVANTKEAQALPTDLKNAVDSNQFVMVQVSQLPLSSRVDVSSTVEAEPSSALGSSGTLSVLALVSLPLVQYLFSRYL